MQRYRVDDTEIITNSNKKKAVRTNRIPHLTHQNDKDVSFIDFVRELGLRNRDILF